MKVYLVGGGRAGRALAELCAHVGHEVLGVHHRRREHASETAAATGLPCPAGPLAAVPPEAELVFLTVPDRAIEDTARELWMGRALTDRQVLAHASGSVPARVLRQGAPGVRAVVSLHPLQSLTGEADTGRLLAASFFVEGESLGLDAARSLLAPAGILPIVLSAGMKPLYHASAVLASNALVALADAAADVLARAGISPRDALTALLPLMEGTLANLRAVGLPDALTGPASRGDAETVAAHLAALGSVAPGLVPLYVALADRTLDVATAQGRASQDALARVRALLHVNRDLPLT